MTWQDRALCAGTADVSFSTADPFFPETSAGRNRNGSDVYAEARLICAACPVRTECAEDAISTERGMAYGFRGGMSETQRQALHRKRGRGTRTTESVLRGLNADKENERTELYERGLSDKRISVLTGLDESSVRRWRDRRGLPANHLPDGSRAVAS